MIKREFSKIEAFINYFPEKDISTAIRKSLLDKIEESFFLINEVFMERETFLLQNLIINDHGIY